VEVEVECRKLSQFIDRKVDVLKMDIEGAEQKVLEELYQAGSLKYLDTCLVEYHYNIKDQKNASGKFLSTFEEQGFQYSISGRYKKVKGVQDVFLHIYKNGHE
jgi:hypothetical protein